MNWFKWRWSAICAISMAAMTGMTPLVLLVMHVPFYLRPPGSITSYHHGQLYTMEVAEVVALGGLWLLGMLAMAIPWIIMVALRWITSPAPLGNWSLRALSWIVRKVKQ